MFRRADKCFRRVEGVERAIGAGDSDSNCSSPSLTTCQHHHHHHSDDLNNASLSSCSSNAIGCTEGNLEGDIESNKVNHNRICKTNSNEATSDNNDKENISKIKNAEKTDGDSIQEIDLEKDQSSLKDNDD